jgi:MSHA biogenesis protein MshK
MACSRFGYTPCPQIRGCSVFKQFLLLAALAAPAVAQELYDPTRPLGHVQGVATETPLELNSILIGKDRRIAVINGQQAAERERIGDIVVVRILPNRVIVQRDGRQYELKLHGPLKKKSAS